MHIYNIFSCHLGEHEAGNMSLRMNSSKQVAHKLFQELIYLYLETLFGICVQGLGCIWKESSLKHLPLEIKKKKKGRQIYSFVLNPCSYLSGEVIWFVLCPFILTKSSAREAGMGFGCSTELWVCHGWGTGPIFMLITRLWFSLEAIALGPTCVWNWLRRSLWYKALA